MNLLTRYISKEVIGTLMAVTFILLLVFLSNLLVRYLSYAASGKMAANILMQIMGFELPYLLALLLPLGLYLGLILTFGRLYADNELRVMQLSGFGLNRLLSLTAVIAIAITAIVFTLMLWVNPRIAEVRNNLIAASMSTDNLLDNLLPGRFQVSNDGNRVIYVERIKRNPSLAENVFVAEQKPSNVEGQAAVWNVLAASRGYQTRDQKTQERFLVATDGYRYDGMPGQNAYKIIQFKKYAVRLENAPLTSQRQAEEIIPTQTLWQNYHDPYSAAELQWRLSIPLSAFLLSLLAVPLSKVKPRQGRFVALLPAILLYVVYVNLLFMARNWLEQQMLPINVGLWWVHGLVLGLALILLAMQRSTRFGGSV